MKQGPDGPSRSPGGKSVNMSEINFSSEIPTELLTCYWVNNSLTLLYMYQTPRDGEN